MNQFWRLLPYAWGWLHTIRARLTLWYVALLALILVGFSAFLYMVLARNLHAETDRALGAEAARIIGVLQLDDEERKLGAVPELSTAGMIVVLYDRTGQPFVVNDAHQPQPTLIDALARLDRGDEGFATVGLPDRTQWRVLTKQLAGAGPAALVQVADSERDIEVALSQLTVALGTLVPLTLLLASAGGLFLASRALDPIARITRAAELIGGEDLSRRIEGPTSPDEVGHLAATFNRMLERLEHAFQRQRQFTADASHELRTPLAMLTSQADLALSRRRTVGEYREALASIRDDADRLNLLLSELLTLSRADGGEERLVLEPLTLHELAADLVATMEPLAEVRGVHLERETSHPVTVQGDQTRLTQLVVNLIDNALKYTPAGGQVMVQVGQTDGSAVLSVHDTGIGIAAQHLPHLFDRFYRVDDGRARAQGGAGLGLAISQWIVRAHGGEIEVASQPGQGTLFTVRLPLGHGYRAGSGAETGSWAGVLPAERPMVRASPPN